MGKAGLLLGKSIVALAICTLIGRAVQISLEFTAAKAAEVKDALYDVLPKKEAEKKSVALEDAIAIAAKEYKVNPLILKVISEKESTNGNIRALYRFEPNLFTRLRAAQNYRALSDSEVRMLASSHGAFHILGLTAEKECQLHFSRLYDVEVSAKCAARIIRNIDAEINDKTPAFRLREIFKRYNGQGKAADEYASDAMGRLAVLLFQKVNG